MATFQTRQEHYDECVTKKLPLPEIVDDRTVVGLTHDGSKLLAKEADHNHEDVRVVDGDKIGPWAKSEEEAQEGFDNLA